MERNSVYLSPKCAWVRSLSIQLPDLRWLAKWVGDVSSDQRCTVGPDQCCMPPDMLYTLRNPASLSSSAAL